MTQRPSADPTGRFLPAGALIVLSGLGSWGLWSRAGGAAFAPSAPIDSNELWLLAVILLVALAVVDAVIVAEAASCGLEAGQRPLVAALAGASAAARPLSLSVLTAAVAFAPPLVAPWLSGEGALVPSVVVTALGISLVGSSLPRRAPPPPTHDNRR